MDRATKGVSNAQKKLPVDDLRAVARGCDGVCADRARRRPRYERNASAVRGGIETVDVKTAMIADKTIDSAEINVDTYQDRKLVVLRGSVPTEAQKQRAGKIAQDNASSYKIDNQLAVVPR